MTKLKKDSWYELKRREPAWKWSADGVRSTIFMDRGIYLCTRTYFETNGDEVVVLMLGDVRVEIIVAMRSNIEAALVEMPASDLP